MDKSAEVPFGDVLRALRENAGMTQEALAERAGLSRDAISALERGRRSRPHPPTLAAISDALGLPAGDRAALRAAASRQASDERQGAQRSTVRRIPAQSTRVIGRQQETDSVTDLLAHGGARLISLVGPAGVGKTRLAIELAGQTVDLFPGGTAFVPFAALQDASLILPTIASAMGGRIPDSIQPGERIAFGPAERFLLVLDNLEHLSGAPGVIAQLVASAPDVTVLVTSRAPLRLQGERVYPLQPFAVDASNPEQDAVDLFLERARAVDPGFSDAPRNIRAIEAICQRLDGLPLAIELAAARVKVLPPEALLERLDHSLQLLAGGPRDQEIRLQSIRAAIAWSYDLLDSTEKAAFRALSVFSGGFTMQAAEAVLGAVLGLDEFGTLEIVSSLIDNNLVRPITLDATHPRFLMLFTIRSFGLAELQASADADRVHAAMVEWISGVISRATVSFRDEAADAQLVHFATLEMERGNWRLALSWLLEHHETSRLLLMANDLAWFWYVRGPLREGQSWLARALAQDRTAVSDRTVAAALVGQGMLAYFSGDLDLARASLLESLALQALDRDPWTFASAFLLLGLVEESSGNYAEAKPYLRDALELFESIPHMINASLALGHLGVAHWGTDDLEQARQNLERSIELQRQQSARWWLSTGLGYLSLVAGEQGDLQAAARAEHESLRLRWAETKRDSGDPVRDTNEQRWQAGIWDDAAAALADLAVLASRTGQSEDALLLFGAALASWKQVGRSRANLPERLTYESAEQRARTEIGAAEAQDAYSEGLTLLGEEALTVALEISAGILASVASGETS